LAFIFNVIELALLQEHGYLVLLAEIAFLPGICAVIDCRK